MASYRYERNISPEDLVPEKTRELTPAEARANWWHYHWYYVVLIAAAVLAVGSLMIRFTSRPAILPASLVA